MENEDINSKPKLSFVICHLSFGKLLSQVGARAFHT